MFAAINGHERMIELLIRRGAEVNLQDIKGYTALMYAALLDHPAVVRRLLRAGADAARTVGAGKTALRMARSQGHAECARARPRGALVDRSRG